MRGKRGEEHGGGKAAAWKAPGREGKVDLGGGWRRRGRAGKREIFRAGLAAHPAAPTFVRIYMLAPAGDVFERWRALNDGPKWAKFYMKLMQWEGDGAPSVRLRLPPPCAEGGKGKEKARRWEWELGFDKKRVCG